MKFVIDTNICFSFFKKDSFTKNLIRTSKFTLYAPLFVFEELDKYKEIIVSKSKIQEKEYVKIKEELRKHIKFINQKEYKAHYKKALVITPDPKDVDFFALSLHKNAALWSNDKKLKDQDFLLVVSTADIVEQFL